MANKDQRNWQNAESLFLCIRQVAA